MSRLIDADELIRRLNEKALAQHDIPFVEHDFRELIHDAPTADAVEIVRCNDCKYWNDAMTIAVKERGKTMSDYIKREDAIKAFKRVLDEDFPYISEETPRERIVAIPSADVVEVVRCKDCKHHEELLNNNDGNVLCWVHDIDVIVDENGYCSYGERKDNEHK